jgi:hypothetical protein
MLNIALSGSPGAMVYQDYYRGRYRKKNGRTCNDAMKMMIKMMLFDPEWVRESEGEIM